MLSVMPEEVLLTEDYLGTNKLEARSALFGVLGQMQDVSKQYLVLGELRADLMDITDASVDELRQVNQHDIKIGNSYADATGLFSIINNCNYALSGIDSVAYASDLLSIYASILRVRTWAHLQVAINYGSVPYITKPISGTSDLPKNYPLLTLKQALDSLIKGLLPYSNVDNASVYQSSLNNSIYNLIPDKDVLLGDLYLWKNNYQMAATSYKSFLDRNVSAGGNKYNLTSEFGVTYVLNGTVYTKTDKWANMFQEIVQGNEVNMYIPFTLQYRQPNKSYDLVSSYQVKPSTEIIRNWDRQYKIFNNVLFDSIDTRAAASYSGTRVRPTISKYKYNYMIINRAANVYLKYAEAINQAGYPLHALYVINRGVKDTPALTGTPRFLENTESYLNFTQSKYYTISSGNSINGNLGVRGRVGLAPLALKSASSRSDSIKQIELLILNESALECAFEGNRWPNLMRIALRNNNPAILADAVGNKYSRVGSPLAATVRTKLMDPKNWYLKLEPGANFVPVSN
jgi:hypothetical protein